ncbi:MAG: hypothetical protein WDM76_19175 [Limisphaerales bacterium]
MKKFARDGQKIPAGKTLLKISGPTRAILSAERIALNLWQTAFWCRYIDGAIC